MDESSDDAFVLETCWGYTIVMICLSRTVNELHGPFKGIRCVVVSIETKLLF